MSLRYHICKEKKEKIVRNSPSLHHEHCPQPKEFVEIVQNILQKDARRHQKKPHGSLEQRSEYMSIFNQSVLFNSRKKLFQENISNKPQKIKR
jgi:hypothetical protein